MLKEQEVDRGGQRESERETRKLWLQSALLLGKMHLLPWKLEQAKEKKYKLSKGENSAATSTPRLYVRKFARMFKYKL